MKKLIRTTLIMLFIVGAAWGQDLIYTISGELKNNKAPLDSIMVENLTNNTWMTFTGLPELNYYQINLSKKTFLGGAAGINNLLAEPGFIEIQNIPGSLVLSFMKNTTEKINLSIYNITGQEIYSESNRIINPGNSIRVQPGGSGIYLAKIETPKTIQSFKMIGKAGESAKIDFLERTQSIQPSKSKSIKIETNFDFNVGDSLRVSVFKTNSFAIPLYRKIAGSDSLNFVFEQISDSASVITSGIIDFKEAPGFDISGLSVLTISNESTVRVNGSFQVPNLSDKGEELPILFKKGEAVLFGAIPIDSNGSSITLDEILLFYFKLFPDVAFLELPNANLLELIQANSNHEELIRLIAEALNADSSPTDIPAFNELLQVSANKIVQSKNAGLKSVKTDILPAASFQFEFERKGILSWSSKAPINASMGFEVKSTKDNKIVYGPKLLDPFKWVFSPTSIAAWGIDKFFSVTNGEIAPSYKLTSEGEYQISFTNGQLQGSASNELFQKVKNTNRNAFALDLFFLVVPETGKRFLKDDCGKTVTDMIFSKAEPLAKLINGGSMTKGEVTIKILELREDFIELIVKCGPTKGTDDLKAIRYMKAIVFIMKWIDVLSKLESLSNLISLAHDYYGSTIASEETLSFYDNIAFTELQNKNISGTEFKGAPESKQQYKSEVTEKVSKYVIERDLLETKFSREEYWAAANGLPFNASLVSGDANILDTSPFNTLSGSNFCTFTMGKNTSTAKIEPAFKNSGIKPVMVTFYPKSYKVALLNGDIVTSQLSFENKVLKQLKLVIEDGTEATGIDYNQVAIVGNTNSLVEVEKSLASDKGSIAVKLTILDLTTKQSTSFDVYYQSKKVQTIDAKVANECELGLITAPIITNIELVCNEKNEICILVSFNANGSGVLINGSYYGYCPPEEKCYPVRLSFSPTGAHDGPFELAANGYTVRLKSGDLNKGIIEIKVEHYTSYPFVVCKPGMSAKESFNTYFYSDLGNWIWKVELMNNCNQRSAQIEF